MQNQVDKKYRVDVSKLPPGSYVWITYKGRRFPILKEELYKYTTKGAKILDNSLKDINNIDYKYSLKKNWYRNKIYIDTAKNKRKNDNDKFDWTTFIITLIGLGGMAFALSKARGIRLKTDPILEEAFDEDLIGLAFGGLGGIGSVSLLDLLTESINVVNKKKIYKRFTPQNPSYFAMKGAIESLNERRDVITISDFINFFNKHYTAKQISYSVSNYKGYILEKELKSLSKSVDKLENNINMKINLNNLILDLSGKENKLIKDKFLEFKDGIITISRDLNKRRQFNAFLTKELNKIMPEDKFKYLYKNFFIEKKELPKELIKPFNDYRKLYLFKSQINLSYELYNKGFIFDESVGKWVFSPNIFEKYLDIFVLEDVINQGYYETLLYVFENNIKNTSNSDKLVLFGTIFNHPNVKDKLGRLGSLENKARIMEIERKLDLLHYNNIYTAQANLNSIIVDFFSKDLLTKHGKNTEIIKKFLNTTDIMSYNHELTVLSDMSYIMFTNNANFRYENLSGFTKKYIENILGKDEVMSLYLMAKKDNLIKNNIKFPKNVEVAMKDIDMNDFKQILYKNLSPLVDIIRNKTLQQKKLIDVAYSKNKELFILKDIVGKKEGFLKNIYYSPDIYRADLLSMYENHVEYINKTKGISSTFIGLTLTTTNNTQGISTAIVPIGNDKYRFSYSVVNKLNEVKIDTHHPIIFNKKLFNNISKLEHELFSSTFSENNIISQADISRFLNRGIILEDYNMVVIDTKIFEQYGLKNEKSLYSYVSDLLKRDLNLYDNNIYVLDIIDIKKKEDKVFVSFDLVHIPDIELTSDTMEKYNTNAGWRIKSVIMEGISGLIDQKDDIIKLIKEDKVNLEKIHNLSDYAHYTQQFLFKKILDYNIKANSVIADIMSEEINKIIYLRNNFIFVNKIDKKYVRSLDNILKPYKLNFKQIKFYMRKEPKKIKKLIEKYKDEIYIKLKYLYGYSENFINNFIVRSKGYNIESIYDIILNNLKVHNIDYLPFKQDILRGVYNDFAPMFFHKNIIASIDYLKYINKDKSTSTLLKEYSNFYNNYIIKFSNKEFIRFYSDVENKFLNIFLNDIKSLLTEENYSMLIKEIQSKSNYLDKLLVIFSPKYLASSSDFNKMFYTNMEYSMLLYTRFHKIFSFGITNLPAIFPDDFIKFFVNKEQLKNYRYILKSMYIKDFIDVVNRKLALGYYFTDINKYIDDIDYIIKHTDMFSNININTKEIVSKVLLKDYGLSNIHWEDFSSIFKKNKEVLELLNRKKLISSVNKYLYIDLKYKDVLDNKEDFFEFILEDKVKTYLKNNILQKEYAVSMIKNINTKHPVKSILSVFDANNKKIKKRLDDIINIRTRNELIFYKNNIKNLLYLTEYIPNYSNEIKKYLKKVYSSFFVYLIKEQSDLRADIYNTIHRLDHNYLENRFNDLYITIYKYKQDPNFTKDKFYRMLSSRLNIFNFIYNSKLKALNKKVYSKIDYINIYNSTREYFKENKIDTYIFDFIDSMANTYRNLDKQLDFIQEKHTFIGKAINYIENNIDLLSNINISKILSQNEKGVKSLIETHIRQLGLLDEVILEKYKVNFDEVKVLDYSDMIDNYISMNPFASDIVSSIIVNTASTKENKNMALLQAISGVEPPSAPSVKNYLNISIKNIEDLNNIKQQIMDNYEYSRTTYTYITPEIMNNDIIDYNNNKLLLSLYPTFYSPSQNSLSMVYHINEFLEKVLFNVKNKTEMKNKLVKMMTDIDFDNLLKHNFYLPVNDIHFRRKFIAAIKDNYISDKFVLKSILGEERYNDYVNNYNRIKNILINKYGKDMGGVVDFIAAEAVVNPGGFPDTFRSYLQKYGYMKLMEDYNSLSLKYTDPMKYFNIFKNYMNTDKYIVVGIDKNSLSNHNLSNAINPLIGLKLSDFLKNKRILSKIDNSVIYYAIPSSEITMFDIYNIDYSFVKNKKNNKMQVIPIFHLKKKNYNNIILHKKDYKFYFIRNNKKEEYDMEDLYSLLDIDSFYKILEKTTVGKQLNTQISNINKRSIQLSEDTNRVFKHIVPFDKFKTQHAGVYYKREGFDSIEQLYKYWAANYLSNGKDIYVLPKIDGLRMTIHKQGDRIGIFTEDKWINRVAFLENIVNELKAIKEDFVLDGEIFLYDDKNNPVPRYKMMILSKGVQFDLSGLNYKYYAYDLLYWVNSSLIDKPFYERISLLKEKFNKNFKYIEIPPIIKVSSENSNYKEELENAFNSVIKYVYSEGANFIVGDSFYNNVSGRNVKFAKVRLLKIINVKVIAKREKQLPDHYKKDMKMFFYKLAYKEGGKYVPFRSTRIYTADQAINESKEWIWWEDQFKPRASEHKILTTQGTQVDVKPGDNLLIKFSQLRYWKGKDGNMHYSLYMPMVVGESKIVDDISKFKKYVDEIDSYKLNEDFIDFNFIPLALPPRKNILDKNNSNNKNVSFIIRYLNEKGIIIEPFIDGLFVRIEKKGNDITFFDIGGNIINIPFGIDLPFFSPKFDFSVDGVISMLVNNKYISRNSIIKLMKFSDRRLLNNIGLYIYDVLMMGGADLTNLPYIERKKYLENLKGFFDSNVKLFNYKIINNDINRLYKEMQYLLNNFNGLSLRIIDSIYPMNGIDFGWYVLI